MDCIVILHSVAMVQCITKEKKMFDNIVEVSLAALAVGAVATVMKVITIISAAV